MRWCVPPSHSPQEGLLVFAADTWIVHSSIAFAFGIAFTVLVSIAAVLDVRHRRIPNSVVVLIFSLGTLYLTMGIGLRAGAVRVVEGISVGLLIWLPVWIIGKMGAGDVKFFAASAAWLGPRLALDASLISAFLGGVLALVWVCRSALEARGAIESPRQVAAVPACGTLVPEDREDTEVSRVTLPYGVAMAVGLTLTAWFPHLIR
jgi:prepilin peptidase CpaA